MLKAPFVVSVTPISITRFEALVGEEEVARIEAAAKEFREKLQGKTIWNINSTAVGGGVAEMLPPLLGHALGSDIPAKWLVMQGDDLFFKITKRIHNGLHGSVGDGGLLGKGESDHYRAVMDDNLHHLRERIRSGDIVILHDPQTAGLAPGLKKLGCIVIWRCHIGHDSPNKLVKRSWAFLQPFIQEADALCFTRRTYAPAWANPDKVHVVPPSIDPFSVKNQGMDAATVRSIVSHLGIVEAVRGDARPLTFQRSDGSSGQIKRHADILHAGPLPTADSNLVVQVSRWDRLKDMVGVMRGFADYVADHRDVHLALVGPNVHGVADDPEGAVIYEQCVDIWRQLPHFRRNRVQLVTLPTKDVDENAAMVNAIQRYATVVVQKSLYEGFGLTVAEAMWKEKPVVASAVGGISDQVVDGKNGLLVRDPTNLIEFGEALRRLLQNPGLRTKFATAARQTIKDRYLTTRHLMQYAELVAKLCDGEASNS